jgi:uncharacterized phiE125 gp8 family phage protein
MQPWQPIALLPVRTADPATRLLTTDEAKTHLRVDDSAEDGYVDSLVLTAEHHLDGFSGVLGRALITQTWQRSFDGFPCGDTIRLPIGPLQAGLRERITIRRQANTKNARGGLDRTWNTLATNLSARVSQSTGASRSSATSCKGCPTSS